MFTLFGAIIGARVHAFFAEFGMLIGAAACVAAAIALLSLPNIPILASIKRILAYVLFGVAIGLLCWFGGFRQGRSLSAEADLRRQIEAQQALLAEKERQREAADKARLAAAMREREADERSKTMQDAIEAYEKQEMPRAETKIVRVPGKTVVRDVCSVDPAFERGVQSIDAAGRVGPPRSPAHGR